MNRREKLKAFNIGLVINSIIQCLILTFGPMLNFSVRGVLLFFSMIIGPITIFPAILFYLLIERLSPKWGDDEKENYNIAFGYATLLAIWGFIIWVFIIMWT